MSVGTPTCAPTAAASTPEAATDVNASNLAQN